MTANIKYLRIQPDNLLRHVINYYWVMDNLNIPQNTPDLLVPDGYAEIIFILSGGYKKWPVSDESKVQTIDCSSVIGIQRNSIAVVRTGYAKMVGVKFKPLGAYLFFGTPIIDAVNRTIPIDDFGDDKLIALNKKLQPSTSIDEVKTLLDTEFISRLTNSNLYNRAFRQLSDISECIFNNQGNIKVNQLALDSGLNKKQLERYFKRYIGIPPKAFISIIRFKYMYKKYVLNKNKSSHFFDVGYYDQSHFIQDFKKYTGVSPRMSKADNFQDSNDIAKKSLR